MYKLILITIIIACSFPGFAQSEQVKAKENASVTGVTAEGEEIFTSVEQMPEFPGGMDGLMKYLNGNIRYPKKARRNDVEGKVVVQFVVSKAGKIINVEVKRDPGGGCGKEAFRVVSNMPHWKPGKQNGKSVNVYYTLPISFKLTDDVPEKGKNKG